MATSKTKWFETPTSGFGYAGKFYLRVFQSLKQEEAFNLSADLPPMKTSWFLTDEKYEQWMKLLAYDDSLPKQAFTFSAPAGVWALMQVLEDLGISFSRIMHMGSRLRMGSTNGFKPDQHYSTYVHYRGARPHSKRAVLIRFQSIVRDVTGHEVMNLEDELYVAGLQEDFVKNMTAEATPNERRATQSVLLTNSMADKIPMQIKRGMGQKYGKLSGDLNPLHISSIGARLFGHKKSFVQGLCTLNLIVAELGRHWQGSIKSIDIRFLRPVSQPSKLTLLCTLTQFELVDKDGVLLVSGIFSHE